MDGSPQSERTTDSRLMACRDCDALLRKPPLRNRQVARCPRCGATLYRGAAAKLDRLAALALGALITFMIAQSFPVIGLDANGITSQSSLPGALVVLWGEDMQIVAAIVFCATILFPLAELLALLYVLLPVRHARVPPGFDLVLRTIQFVRPWGMLEVFLLGALVTIVKMTDLARVIPGTALFAFGALALMFTIVATFDARALWDIADGLRARQRNDARDGARQARVGRAGRTDGGDGGGNSSAHSVSRAAASRAAFLPEGKSGDASSVAGASGGARAAQKNNPGNVPETAHAAPSTPRRPSS